MTQEKRISELERLVVSLCNRVDAIEKFISLSHHMNTHDKFIDIQKKIDALDRKIDTKKSKTFFRHTM
jgi:hypothetical protein